MWNMYFRGQRRGLRRIALSLLSERPLNGAEIMQEVETMSFGLWKPSPGSIYPLLEQLSDEGLIRKREDGRYVLTNEGKKEAGSYHLRFLEPRSPPQMIQEMRSYISYFEDIGKQQIEQYRKELEELRDRISALLQ